MSLDEGNPSLHSFNWGLLPSAYYLCCDEIQSLQTFSNIELEIDHVWISDFDDDSAYCSTGRESILSTFDLLYA